MTRVYALDHEFGLPPAAVSALVGGTAATLGVMARELGLPVPPGFAITTAACREYLAAGWPAGLDEELRDGMARIEAGVGRRFGDPSDPLLVSVRSGAPVSMPGMMDTILDLGLNDRTVVGLGTVASDPAFAEDCHQRFRRMFRAIVGSDVPDDPWAQLRLAVEAVFRSWNSDRAIAYRRREGIPDDIGTGVTIQAMVFGNHGDRSATGVAFTRNPATGEPGLYGDVMFGAQGEDVVAGTHATEPLSALDTRLPDAARGLRAHAALLERHYRDLCDIEFTIEDGRLWMLQVRVGKRSPRAALRIAIDMAEDDGFPLTRAEAVERVASLLRQPPRLASERPVEADRLITGLPASPGIATGEIAITPEAALEAADAGRAPILVRNETSPDDVHGMARSAGILTATGGLASHAAVVARGWGIPAVVGARELEVREGQVLLPGVTLAPGDPITIDGDTGGVYRGGSDAASEIVPEAQTLLAWAKELGIAIGTPEAGPAADEAPSAAVEAAGDADDCLLAIGTKGFATTDSVAIALRSTVDSVKPLVDGLVAGGLVKGAAGAWRLTEGGRARADELIAAERGAIGLDRTTVWLDGFLAFDGRVKATVTAWQMRPTDGEAVFNDHADAAYDARVLADLTLLHRDAVAWAAPIEPAWPRARTYRLRLDDALKGAAGGDVRFVASPRVDSYHGIWFELHEDLIHLAGRTREDEVAAGRA